jgi:hypothetical protein
VTALLAGAERLFGKRAADTDGLRRLRESRNGITHMGLGEDASRRRALLSAGILYISDLLSALSKDPAWFWGKHEPMTRELVQEAVTGAAPVQQQAAAGPSPVRGTDVAPARRTAAGGDRRPVGSAGPEPMVPGRSSGVPGVRESRGAQRPGLQRRVRVLVQPTALRLARCAS